MNKPQMQVSLIALELRLREIVPIDRDSTCVCAEYDGVIPSSPAGHQSHVLIRNAPIVA